jgi:hypothetical protein
MVRFIVDIEAAAGDPRTVNILLKTKENQPAEAEETTARRLLPALCELLRTGFPESDEARDSVAEESPIKEKQRG